MIKQGHCIPSEPPLNLWGTPNRSLSLIAGFSNSATHSTKTPPSQRYLVYVCKQDISLMTAFLKNRGAFDNPTTTAVTPSPPLSFDHPHKGPRKL
ncbi:hypothetical protein TNCT_337201 [Trichonephila clavata]|uniref:Uncharacterized protein n=1 Tax=Trichonephila clavata TaxID=2740835 RepID=A0A8X6KKZ7_TRICU|nr:hypothetical protein TNCT_337201 [Trichonephila clavata]